MQQIFSFLAANPWIWVVAAVGLGVWIAALWAVITRPKFRRKWLWGLLCFFSFSFNWQVGPGAFVSIGFPVGALYVLWFWRFGASPSAEQLAVDQVRRETRRIAHGSRARMMALRSGYLVAAAATAVIAWGVLSGQLWAMFAEFARDIPRPAEFAAMRDLVTYGDGAFVAAFIALFVFLSFRPYWWGKILCVWAGLAWVGFGLIARLAFRLSSPLPGYVLAAGLAMLAAAVVLQIADPRFGGSYLRKTEPA